MINSVPFFCLLDLCIEGDQPSADTCPLELGDFVCNRTLSGEKLEALVV